MEGRRFTQIDFEHTLFNAVIPRIAKSLLVNGVGTCANGRYRVGCSLFQVSRRFTQALIAGLPKCQEPNCGAPGMHMCAGESIVCCIHAIRFKMFHRRTRDLPCLCCEPMPEESSYNRFEDYDDEDNVSINWFGGGISQTYWHKGSPLFWIRLSTGQYIEGDHSVRRNLADETTGEFRRLLYENSVGIDNLLRRGIDMRVRNKRIKTRR